jgi:Uma2 family endonuclease
MTTRKTDSAGSTTRDDPTPVTTYRTRTRTAKEQHPLATAIDTKKVEDDTTLDMTSLSQPVDPQSQLSEAQFIKVFNSAYNEFYQNNALSDTTRKLIEAQDVDIELFDHLTEKKQNQRYISLLDGRIIFHELPNAPHGEIIDRIHDIIWRQIDHDTFQGCSDNDCCIGNSKKRPDASWRIRKSHIPNPRPTWIKLLPNNPYNLPFPSIIVEVVVNNESLAILEAFAQQYFAASTSVRVYVGVKIWLVEKRFWVGWGERRPNGTGCRLTSNMAWPPNAWPIANPVDLVYQIPMTTVYGPGIPIPENAPATLDISVEEIRQEIIGVIM